MNSDKPKVSGSEWETFGPSISIPPQSTAPIASVEEIARNYETKLKYWWGNKHLNVANEIRDAIQSALAPVVAERDELREKLDPANWTVVEDSSMWTLAEALEMHRRKAEQVLSLQAELEQAKEETARAWQEDTKHFRELLSVQARLVTAEADTKRLDWLDANRGNIFAWAHTRSARQGIDFSMDREGDVRDASQAKE